VNGVYPEFPKEFTPRILLVYVVLSGAVILPVMAPVDGLKLSPAGKPSGSLSSNLIAGPPEIMLGLKTGSSPVKVFVLSMLNEVPPGCVA
jgi:hypothetical protein